MQFGGNSLSFLFLGVNEAPRVSRLERALVTRSAQSKFCPTKNNSDRRQPRRCAKPPCFPPRWQNGEGELRADSIPNAIVVAGGNFKVVLPRRQIRIRGRASQRL